MTNPSNPVFGIRVEDGHIVIGVPDHGTSIVVFSDGYEDDDNDCDRDLLAAVVVDEVIVDKYVVSDQHWNYIVIDDYFADEVINLIRSVLDD